MKTSDLQSMKGWKKLNIFHIPSDIFIEKYDIQYLDKGVWTKSSFQPEEQETNLESCRSICRILVNLANGSYEYRYRGKS